MKAPHLCIFFAALFALAGAWADNVNTNPDDMRGRGADDHLLPPDPRIPVPKPLKVKVMRGDTITIDLQTVGDVMTQRVDYVVREEPQAGTVTKPVAKPQSRAMMTVNYTPDPQVKVETDSFTYGASYPNGRVSAPVKVEITIAEPLPRLELPADVDFGSTVVGSQSVRTVPVTNLGKAVFDQELWVPKPWSWIPEPGEKTCRIGPGETRQVSFSFQPEEKGAANVKVGWGVIPEEKSLFYGDAFHPFLIGVEDVILRYDADEGIRASSISVASYHPQGLPLRVKGSGRVQAHIPGDAILRKGQSAQVHLFLTPDDVAPLEENVTFSMGDYSQTILVRAPPSPARLELVMEDRSAGVDFGEVSTGEKALKKLVMRNAGGIETSFRLDVPLPFRIEEGDHMRTMNPLETCEWIVSFQPDAPGNYSRSVNLGSDLGILLLSGMAEAAGEKGGSKSGSDKHTSMVAEAMLRSNEDPKAPANPASADGSEGPVVALAPGSRSTVLILVLLGILVIAAVGAGIWIAKREKSNPDAI